MERYPLSFLIAVERYVRPEISSSTPILLIRSSHVKSEAMHGVTAKLVFPTRQPQLSNFNYQKKKSFVILLVKN